MYYHFVLGLHLRHLPALAFFAHGYLWVDLFFILSGFVLAYGHSHRFSRQYRPAAHLSFLVSRFARIFPLYAIVTVESACLLVWRTDHSGLGILALNLLMVQAWGLAASLEGAAWSVSTEWAAYLLFPLLLGVSVQPRRRVAVVTACVMFAALAVLACSAGPYGYAGQGRSGALDIYSAATPAPLLRCLTEFVLGLVMFRVAGHERVRGCSWTGPLALGAAALVAVTMSFGLDLATVLLFCLLLVALSQQRGTLSALLGAAIPYRLGQWSYSIYLLHDKFIHLGDQLRVWLSSRVPFATSVAMLMTSFVVVAVSALVFACVERPLRRVTSNVVRTLPWTGAASVRPDPPAPGMEART
jgi:peptidoglycan/LPS O-acetylase OafA/YrhL